LRAGSAKGYVKKGRSDGGPVRASAKPAAIHTEPKFGRGTGIPNPIDIHVGKRIRIRRVLLGMNQETLAGALGLTFQQVQKYEVGTNRISASRLSAVAETLGVPISYFFDALPPTDVEVSAEDQARRDLLEQPETLELIRLYYTISDAAIRRQVLQMIKAVAQSVSTKM
jgi:transcriptional regulator with XRE-family HTH domain